MVEIDTKNLHLYCYGIYFLTEIDWDSNMKSAAIRYSM